MDKFMIVLLVLCVLDAIALFIGGRLKARQGRERNTHQGDLP
jgi:hypothetical protein